MSGRRFALFAAFAFLIMFVAANLIANSWFRSWRLDLTQAHVYSLSPGTEEVLTGLTEPVQLTLYYSRDAVAQAPQVQAYGARVREMLQTFSARSHGRVRFTEVNVKPFTEQEDAAVEAGIEAKQVFEGGDPLYFGLAGANAINDTRAIPFFDPAQEPFLEYQITRLIYELENPDLKHVALITSLPIDPAEAAAPQGMGAAPQTTFATEMGRVMQVEKLPADFTEIPADVDVLAIIHPPQLSAIQSYAIDQFVMRKGRAFIALDPASMMASRAAYDPSNPTAGGAPTSSNLEPLLGAWGVAMSRDVVLDLDGALQVNAQGPDGQPTPAPQPLFFHVPAEAQMDRQDLMTAALHNGINFGMPGALNISERSGITETILAKTSAHTMHMPAEEALAQPGPADVLRQWPIAGGHIENLAVHISGRLPSAFPNGPPEGAPPASDGSAPMRLSNPAQIVIVSDADFLADEFYVQNGAAAADNGSFALNAIDVLGGSNALVSLRSRGPSQRRMELLDRMENEAQQRIEQRQQELQNQLQATESHLAELQSSGHGSGFFTGNLGAELTPAERHEIDEFRNRAIQIRTGLRGVQRDLRTDINHLETLIVFLDMWLAPILVAAAGLFLFWRRQRRGRARTPK